MTAVGFERARPWLVAVLSVTGGAALMTLVGAAEARADFRVCNGTQSLVGVAIGYRGA